jgi:hypothetical protein
MGSTLHVKLCPHKVWREKYGCAKCDTDEGKDRCAYPTGENTECDLQQGHAGPHRPGVPVSG